MAVIRELLAVPMQTGATSDIQSGIARKAGVLWCTRHRDESARSRAVMVFVHPSSNFMAHYALDPLARLGIDAVGMTTRYLGNESALQLENCVVDIGSVLHHLREEGYEQIVLAGNSGGGGLVALYQDQARKATITSPPAGGAPDLTQAVLPPADALVMLMAHPGRSSVLTEKIDPAIVDEADPFRRDPELDLFDPNHGPPYSEEFLERYRAAQLERNRRITAWTQARLAELPELSDGRVDDLPFVVHGTMADPRNLDLSLDPSDRKATTQWGPPYRANLTPATLAHFTTLRSWQSQWSYDLSNGHGPTRLREVDVPVHVVYGTADPGCYPGHARSLYDAVPHDRKLLTPVVGGGHYLYGQPEQLDFTVRLLADWTRSL